MTNRSSASGTRAPNSPCRCPVAASRPSSKRALGTVPCAQRSRRRRHTAERPHRCRPRRSARCSAAPPRRGEARAAATRPGRPSGCGTLFPARRGSDRPRTPAAHCAGTPTRRRRRVRRAGAPSPVASKAASMRSEPFGSTVHAVRSSDPLAPRARTHTAPSSASTASGAARRAAAAARPPGALPVAEAHVLAAPSSLSVSGRQSDGSTGASSRSAPSWTGSSAGPSRGRR